MLVVLLGKNGSDVAFAVVESREMKLALVEDAFISFISRSVSGMSKTFPLCLRRSVDVVF